MNHFFESLLIFLINFITGGKRNWVQVLCNGIVATMVAIIYISECGCQENAIDFIDKYRCSMLSYAFIGNLTFFTLLFKINFFTKFIGINIGLDSIKFHCKRNSNQL